jgi:serine/threonine-protein kinase
MVDEHLRAGDGPRLVVTSGSRGDGTVEAKPAASSGTRPLKWIGYGLGGLGVVGLGLGAFFGLKAISKNDDATSQCRTATLCSPAGLALHDEARSAATTSTLLVVIGSAALVGGIALVLTAPSTPSSSSRSVTLHAGPTSVGLTGRF